MPSFPAPIHSRVFVVALFATGLIAGCKSMPPTSERYAALPAGSVFVNAVRNTGSFGAGESMQSITVGERDWNGERVLTFTTPQGILLLRPDGGRFALISPAGDKTLVSWDPPTTHKWPMTIGTSWTKAYKMTLGNGRVVPYEETCRVAAYEDVVVPAGSFKVFREECSQSIGTQSTYWFSPEFGIHMKQSHERAAQNPLGGAGTQTIDVTSLSVKK